jgi:uncharacterized cupredoxin-like copper-binding protein
MTRRSTIGSVCVLAFVLLALPACGDDDGGGSTGASGGATTVDVTLQEFAVIPGAASAPAGSITFNATNMGPEDDHELVVIRTDLAPDALPTQANGAVDEEGEGVEAIDEVEDIAGGSDAELTVNLDAGSYVVICNLPGHYRQGMHAAFTVS